MSDLWVLNASPVIVLARVGRADLITGLADAAVVPTAVAQEIQAGPENDPARQWIGTGTVEIVETPSPPAELLAWDLGTGETAVLADAMATPESIAILDDAAARKCARSFSLSVKGTLALVVLAKQRGLITSAAEVIHELQAVGFRIDDRVVRKVLAQAVQEAWPAADSC